MLLGHPMARNFAKGHRLHGAVSPSPFTCCLPPECKAIGLHADHSKRVACMTPRHFDIFSGHTQTDFDVADCRRKVTYTGFKITVQRSTVPSSIIGGAVPSTAALLTSSHEKLPIIILTYAYRNVQR